MKYSELTRRQFESPARVGTLSGPGCYRGAAGNRSSGTWVQFDVRVTQDAAGAAAAQGRVREVRFLALGCPHVIAAAALIAGLGEGGPADPCLPYSVQALRERLEAPIEKLGRLFVVEDAWVAALRAAADGRA
jgi:NifU-like protein involved in Fe-S cluster formation